MGKREKLIDRLTNSPQNATFADLRNLLEYEGFYLDKVTNTHHIFIYAETIFVIPVHNGKVKLIYVEKVLELIVGGASPAENRADTELEEDD